MPKFCVSLSNTSHIIKEQSISDPPEAVGISFATDVIRRNRQYILVLRETSTSITASCLFDNKRHETLRDALIRLCVELSPLDGPSAVIRTDPAPGFARLIHDKLLQQHCLTVEIVRVKNVNRNPTAEKAVRKLEDELIRLDPMGGPTTALSLSLATANLNSRIR